MNRWRRTMDRQAHQAHRPSRVLQARDRSWSVSRAAPCRSSVIEDSDRPPAGLSIRHPRGLKGTKRSGGRREICHAEHRIGSWRRGSFSGRATWKTRFASGATASPRRGARESPPSPSRESSPAFSGRCGATAPLTILWDRPKRARKGTRREALKDANAEALERAAKKLQRRAPRRDKTSAAMT